MCDLGNFVDNLIKFVDVDTAMICFHPESYTKCSIQPGLGNIAQVSDGVFIILKSLWARKFSGLHNGFKSCRAEVRFTTPICSQPWYWISFCQQCHTLIICVQKLIFKMIMAYKIFSRESQIVLLMNLSHYCLQCSSFGRENTSLFFLLLLLVLQPITQHLFAIMTSQNFIISLFSSSQY